MALFGTIFPKVKDFNRKRALWEGVLKGTSIIILAPFMLIAILVTNGELELSTALYGMAFIVVMSFIFVYPYVANLASLTSYVKALSLDKKAFAPDVSFLNNVQELSTAVLQLHDSWAARKDQLEAALAESRILIDSLPDIIIMLDEELNIKRTNSTAKTMLGGRNFQNTLENIIQDDDVNAYAQMVFEDGIGREIEYFLPAPYYSNYIIRIERFPVRSAKDGIAVIIVMHDITKQKQTERMLSDFVANASHEIRTPLTSVIGFIETLQTTAKDDPEASEKFLSIMASQTDRIANLVSGLLSLSQIERSLHERPSGQVNIPAILREVQAHASALADTKDITVNLDIKGNIPTIIGETSEVYQIFENLLSNAIKYGHSSSMIKIHAELIDNNYKDINNFDDVSKLVKIDVKDEGDGIPPEHIPRLTERFYCVDPARSRKIGGTGLGLSIVNNIIEHHRGALKISSTVGEGSCFTVLLPV